MNKIKIILERKGKTQIWLSQQLGKSYTMVNAYAQNWRHPSIELLYDIANLLKVDVKELLISSKRK